jgi:hypothetical protein
MTEFEENIENTLNTQIIDLGEKYQFNTGWDVWYHHSLNDWSIGGYRKIFSISNIKNFWDFHNNIECIGGINNLHFFMMRKGITPIYEDTKNRNGGVWSLLVPMAKAYDVWEEIASGMCGEYLIKDMSMITGLSINFNSKNNVSVIKIWNNDRIKNDTSILPSFLKQYGNIIYRKHQLDF